jgi:hypothetical protein
VAKSGNRLAREKGRPDKARFKAELDTPDTTLIFCKPYRVLSAFTSRDVDGTIPLHFIGFFFDEIRVLLKLRRLMMVNPCFFVK